MWSYEMFCFVFFFKQKTAYEMRISDWSSDVCSSDLIDKAGKVKAWRFTRALIRVAANIPYEQAQAAIDAAESGKSDGRFEADGIDLVDNALKPLWACWALLAKARGKIGRASGRERVCQCV